MNIQKENIQPWIIPEETVLPRAILWKYSGFLERVRLGKIKIPDHFDIKVPGPANHYIKERG